MRTGLQKLTQRFIGGLVLWIEIIYRRGVWEWVLFGGYRIEWGWEIASVSSCVSSKILQIVV